MTEPEKVHASLLRMIDMDMLSTYEGRCPRCAADPVTIYVPQGDLLMSSHPTTRLGACLGCWSVQVEATLALAAQAPAAEEPAPGGLVGRLDAAERRLAAVEARQRALLHHDPDCGLFDETKRTRVCDCWLSEPEGS